MAFVFGGFFSAIHSSPAATVRIRLETTDLNSNAVSQIEVGEPFLLRGFVTDLRDNPQGIFAAYYDVEYLPASFASVTGSLTFAPPYTNGETGDASTAGLIDEIGSFGGFSPPGSGEKLQFSVRMQANNQGLVTFSANPADQPGNGVLVYGGNSAVPFSEIEYVGATLLVMSPRRLAFTGIEFRPEGLQLTLTGAAGTTFQLQAATHLADLAWETVGSNLVIQSDGIAQFLDSEATNHPARYYRALTP